MADRIRLLYVDDDSQSLAIRAEILESQHGMTVRTETNVERGLERIAETRVDCVLSDLQMPERDGIDFLRAVRTLYPDLPFILFTSRESEGIANRALAIGATDYLPKSVVNISYSLLADRIEKAIEIHANRIERRSEADVFSDGGDADDAHADRKRDAEAGERIDAPDRRRMDGFIWLGWPFGEHRGPQQAREPDETVASAVSVVGANGPTVAESDDADRTESDDAAKTKTHDSVAVSDRSEDKWKAATATDTDHERHPIDDAGGAFVFESGADETEVDQSIERPAIERPAIEEIEDRPNGSDSPTDGPSSVRTNGTPTETERRDAFSEEELARLIRNMIRSELKRDRTRANSEEPDDEARIEADRHVKADRRTGTETQGGQIDPIDSDRDPIDSDRDHGRQTADRIDDGWSAIKRTDNDERTTIDNDERTTIDDRPVTDDRSEMEATTDSTTAEPPAEANDSEPPADPATDDTDSETGSDRHDEEATDSVLTNEQREFLEWNDPETETAPVSERPPDEDDGDTDVPAPEASAGPPTTKRISANRIGIDFDPDPGSNTLVQCGTHDGRQHAACLDLLGIGDGADDNVLLVRYRALSGPQLEHIAEHARVVKILAIGYTQQVPDDVADSVDVVNITNPNDLTRLGILVTATVERWTSIESETVVCFGSINVLLRYKSVESVFRFLHIFLGKLRSAGAISHFHVDHLTGDAQHVNTLKPLFDSVITIGATEIRIE